MTKKILFIAVILLAVVSLKSQARGRITYGEHQKIEKVATLPDSIYYETEDGKHIDLGCMYTVFEICYVPIYTQEEPILVGFQGDTYYELDDEIKATIKEDIKVDDLESLNKMPFWDSWGGKLLVAGILIIVFLYYYFKKNKDEEEEQEEAPAETTEENKEDKKPEE